MGSGLSPQQHWFHHILALVYTWYSYGQNISLGRWFVTMNLVVHSLMYGYYVFRALQVYIPRQIAMAVTSLQIIQMIIGFYVSSYAFYSKLSGHYCEIPTKTATFGFLVYVTFFLMFANLFINNYVKSMSKIGSKKQPNQQHQWSFDTKDKCDFNNKKTL